MAFITVYIDDVIPATNSSLSVNFRWFSINDGDSASDSGSAEFDLSTSNSVINQSIIELCVQNSINRGVNISESDRKILASGVL